MREKRHSETKREKEESIVGRGWGEKKKKRRIGKKRRKRDKIVGMKKER
jgi:hypothetical protein